MRLFGMQNLCNRTLECSVPTSEEHPGWKAIVLCSKCEESFLKRLNIMKKFMTVRDTLRFSGTILFLFIVPFVRETKFRRLSVPPGGILIVLMIGGRGKRRWERSFLQDEAIWKR